jgi:hypothetical protein
MMPWCAVTLASFHAGSAMSDQASERSAGRIGFEQGVEYRGYLVEHILWQIAAIAARVGGGFVGFIQGLGDVQGFLNAEPQFARADFLQRAQVEGQGGASRQCSVCNESTVAILPPVIAWTA